MEEDKKYVCHFCGTLYNKPEDAEGCSQNHSTPKKIVKAKFIAKNFNATGYPTILEVEMSDGTIQKYVRKHRDNQ